MTPKQVQTLCISATEAYLKFLVENGRGVQQIRVVHREQIGEQLAESEQARFKLTLAERLFDPETVSIVPKPPNKSYGSEDFQVVEYDGDAKILIIKVQRPELASEIRVAGSLFVESDLKFLVKNVKLWYEENGRKLQLPSQIQESKVAQSNMEAIESSLANSLSYIWGPPGTGKTRHVLTQAALKLLQANKRIAIFAPTNNALELAMASIINTAKETEIGREKFLRIGHPSSKFAGEFPEVCEDHSIKRKLDEMRQQIRNYDMVLNSRRGATVLNSLPVLLEKINEIQSRLQELQKLDEELGNLRRNSLSRFMGKLRGSLPPLEKSRSDLVTSAEGLLETTRRIHTESPKLNGMIECIDFTNLSRTASNIIGLKEETRQYMENSRAIAKEYEGQTTVKLNKLKSELEQEIRDLEAQTILARIKKALVIGMTLDCFIGRFRDTLLSFDHIFVDEAGYVPLIKALTLCRGDIPITLIGDHKQLGPVCEMNDENLCVPENNPALIWRKSALFLDELFLIEDQDDLIAKLFQMNEPELHSFAQARLNKTYRFGQNLADILSACVYQGTELISVGNQQELEIISLNAIPNGKEKLTRQSHGEVEVVLTYLRGQIDLQTDEEEAFAILSPYKNQVALLSHSLVDARRQGRIMTVHKSQGREWDTVILSIVDGRINQPWFTDTNNPKSGGLYVMNTAISRARKRLVIVCDKNFWSSEHYATQLITHLLSIAN